uniref:all-trans-retinol 13,14-reductase-like isoform X2 n=1 Tax=Styela clava TaxID=7725 RepID=UPI00193A2DB8|nr:all-trans-retinol 13,14-reductase-like isoform X2 [Styela clava]
MNMVFGIVEIIIAIVAIAFLYALKVWKNFAKNPFYDDFVRSPDPVVVDQSKRDKVLKVGFKVEKIPADPDAIIIGSGMGGLMCAACLSRAGKKVLVLEQHDRAGGSTHTFEEKGFEFDVDGTSKAFKMKAGEGEYEQNLINQFPKEEKAITEFVKLINQSSDSVVGYALMKMLPIWLLNFLMKTGLYNLLYSRYDKMTKTSAKQILDELTDNEELKGVLGYAFGDYGTFPSDAPFLMHGILMKHFYNGAYYPRGGSSELAFNMIPGIVRSGGAVLVRAPVSKIIFENGRATGVCVSKNGIDHEIKAPIVVSTAGVFNTYQNLIPKDILVKYGVENICDKFDRGLACFQTLVGLKGTTEELGLKRCNYWMYGDVNGEKAMREYLSMPREDAANADLPIAFVSFPSAKDSTWKMRHPGKSVCVIVTLLNWEWFEEWENERVMKRGNVYNDLKKSFQDQVWKKVLEIYPQLEDKVEYIDSGTPLSHKYYLGSPKGDIYGIDHTMRRFQKELGIGLRPETEIPGLYLSGQDTFTCGIMGAATSGIVTSGAILGRNHFLDLYGLMARRKIIQFLKKMK